MNKTYTNRFRSKKNATSKDKKKIKEKKEREKEIASMKIPEEKIYKTLDRQDFDINIKKYWCELRIKNPPVRRTNHVGFLYKDYYYIFGGRDINMTKMNDMYKIHLDLNSENIQAEEWQKVENYGDYPDLIAEHRGVLIDDKFYIYGGVNASEEELNSVYIYSIEDQTWEKKEFSEDEVPPRTGHSMTGYGNSLIVFGGFAKGKFSNDVFIYDTEENSWEHVPTDYKDPRTSSIFIKNLKHDNKSTIQADVSREIPEGMEGVQKEEEQNIKKTIENELKISKKSLSNYDTKQILENNSKYPAPRINHSQVTYNTSIIIYGGINKNGKYFDDMWEFNIANRTWKKIEFNGETPKPRQGHSALLIGDNIYIFGGKIANVFEINEFWKFDLLKSRFELIEGSLLEKEGFYQQFKPKPIIETSTNHNPYQTFYKLKKVQIPNEDEESINKNADKEKTNPYENIIMGDNKARNIKHSLIFKIEHEDINYINKLAQANKYLKFERFKYGEVPVPRDGHTVFLHQGRMCLFGGDRNKFPFNDVYFFDFVKLQKDQEKEKERSRISNVSNIVNKAENVIDENDPNNHNHANN